MHCSLIYSNGEDHYSVDTALLLLLSFELSNDPTNLYASGNVHTKDVDGCASDRSQPKNESVILKTKVCTPDVGAGIEESRQFTSVRVDAGKIRSLLVIAEVTSEGEVFQFIRPAMLSGNDMFDVEGEIGVITLVNSAILTTTFSSLANELFSFVIHYAVRELEAHARAFNRRSATKSISSM